MDKINDAIIVSIDYNESDRTGVLLVGRKRRGGGIDIINAFSGNEALELYKKLVTIKVTIKENNK